MVRRTLLLGVLAGSLATALAGGIAWAAIPSADGTIRACYDNGGALKVIDEGKSCAKGWKGPITWGQQQALPGYEVVTQSKSYAANVIAIAIEAQTATCPAGKKVVGGGGDVRYASDADPEFVGLPVETGDVHQSGPGLLRGSADNAWTIIYSVSDNFRHQPFVGTAYAICASVL